MTRVSHGLAMRKKSLKALHMYSSEGCIVLQTDSYNLYDIAVTKFPKSLVNLIF